MSKILNRFRHDIVLVMAGFQETMVSIADHVNQSVQKIKIDLATAELENEIKKSQVHLGKLIYERERRQSSSKTSTETSSEALKAELAHLPEIKALREKAEAGQKSLDSIVGTVSPHDALQDFERLLIRSNFVIQHVLITDGFKGIGKMIRDLELPDRMLIFFIKKNKGIEIAEGGIIVEVKDEVTFLCSKENCHKYIEFWS